MKHLIHLLFAILCFQSILSAQLHSDWDSMLETFVTDDGRVDYKAWKVSEKRLVKYLEMLSENVPDKDFSREESMAYWINAYNAFTIKLILDHYPVSSIMDIANGKPWDMKWIDLGGRKYSLNQIEHDILREKFNDARIHFAVNCAAVSCPPLMNRAFIPDKLDDQLDKRAIAFINDSRFNKVTSTKVVLSRIFEWYAADFGSIKQYLDKYYRGAISNSAQIVYTEYNWGLNQIK